MVTMVTMGGDLQPGCLADWLLTGLGRPQIHKSRKRGNKCSVLLSKVIVNKSAVDLLQQVGASC